jgi:hypothetical protein
MYQRHSDSDWRCPDEFLFGALELGFAFIRTEQGWEIQGRTAPGVDDDGEENFYQFHCHILLQSAQHLQQINLRMRSIMSK